MCEIKSVSLCSFKKTGPNKQAVSIHTMLFNKLWLKQIADYYEKQMSGCKMKFCNKSLNCSYNACCRSPNAIDVSEHQERKKLDSIEQVSSLLFE